MIFYGTVILILCITMLITHCTYQVGACKVEAIKAGVPTEKIANLCREG
jgi:hypothetical protein